MILSFFHNPNHPAATVNAIILPDANGLVLFVVRNQALVAKLLDVNLTVDNKNTNLPHMDGIALFNEDFVPVVIGRLHVFSRA